jgi:hypothetical protein
MIGFLKSFFSNDRGAEEQALAAALDLQKKRDVMVVGGFEMGEEQEEEEGSCQPRGCGGCGCG